MAKVTVFIGLKLVKVDLGFGLKMVKACDPGARLKMVKVPRLPDLYIPPVEPPAARAMPRLQAWPAAGPGTHASPPPGYVRRRLAPLRIPMGGGRLMRHG